MKKHPGIAGEKGKEMIKHYIELVKKSVGNNPRAIKRIYNQFEKILWLQALAQRRIMFKMWHNICIVK